MKNLFKKIIDILFKDEYYSTRTNLNSSLSMVVNIIWALIKIFTGIWTRAYVLCVSGLFTMGLGCCKIYYFTGLQKKEEHHKCVIKVAIVLLIASLAYSTYMILLFIYPEEPRNYGLILSIFIALVAFLKLFFSIKGIIKMSKRNEPLMLAIKGVNLSGALANIVLTQACLLVACSEMIDYAKLSTYNGITGTVVGMISIGISVGLLIIGFKKKNIIE